jgi:beta-phosphoglucomutase
VSGDGVAGRIGTILAFDGAAITLPGFARMRATRRAVEAGVPLTGGIFDIDGVLLDTPHERAWREALDALMAGSWRDLASRTGYRPGALTSTIYQEQVAGKPRAMGAAAVLAYFHVPDPEGGREREYSAAKQEALERLAAAGEVRAYDDAVRFLLATKAAGVRVCAASSSQNADGFLRGIAVAAFAPPGAPARVSGGGATLLDLFDADVNGRAVPRGKPDPTLFLAAAEALRLPPESCFVVEDAPAGIAAARAGGMYAIGVARHDDAAGLRDKGATIVTTRLDTIDVAALLRGDLRKADND